MNSIARSIRRTALSERVPLNEDLLKIIDGFPSHEFLRNPAGQNVYLYLTRYVRAFAESHFNKGIDEIALLDWGCGKGQVAFLLRRLGAKPQCCDISGGIESPEKTPIIKKDGIQVDPLIHDYLLPYGDETFDVVMSFGVLEHVSHDSKSLVEINRILREGGLLFCFDLPYFLSWTQRLAHIRGDCYHDRLYRKRHVYELLDSSGFSLMDVWHRQLFPKNSVKYPAYHLFERIDQLLTEYTPLKYLATCIDFVAQKRTGQ